VSPFGAGLAVAGAVPEDIAQKEPAISDGCQSREEVVRTVSRFAGALCVAIHTRTGNFVEPPWYREGRGPERRTSPRRQ
jgi:hypothetical protein